MTISIMEANFVLKAADLSNDFADGIVKLFSPNATLRITVEYGDTSSSSASSSTTASATPGRRGRKPGGQQQATTGKKRGRKPGSTSKVAASTGEAPKKRGRKPKNATV